MTSYFELTELHIDPRAQGRGLGEASDDRAPIPTLLLEEVAIVGRESRDMF